MFLLHREIFKINKIKPSNMHFFSKFSKVHYSVYFDNTKTLKQLL